MYKRCIGEKIDTAYKVFLIACPSDLDSPIKVSYSPVLIFGGAFYYEGNKAEIYNEKEELKKAMSVENARKIIPNYQEGEKISLAYAFCNVLVPWAFSIEQEQKANEKLHNKLVGMTYRKYLNSKW